MLSVLLLFTDSGYPFWSLQFFRELDTWEGLFRLLYIFYRNLERFVSAANLSSGVYCQINGPLNSTRQTGE